MPTRIGGHLTDEQRMRLTTGWSFWYVGSPEPPPFRDDAEMREAWLHWRTELLAEWRTPWRRPWAYWRFDHGLRPKPGGFLWPRGVRTQEQMVRKLLSAGLLAPLPGERADTASMPTGVRRRLTSAR